MTTTAPVLTARQLQILELMAEGLTRPQIATRLWLGVHTVATHQRRVYARLGVHTGHGAVAAGYKAGLLHEPATTSKEHSTMEQFTEYAIRVTHAGHLARITPYATYPRDAIRGYDHAVELYGEEAVEFLQRTVRRTEWVAGKLPPAPGLPPDQDGGLCEPIFREKPIRDVGSVDAFEEPLIVSGPDSVALTEAVLRGDL